jgi:thioredoxin-like negative regulator of GroEL
MYKQLLYFSKTDCAPCKQIRPWVERMAQQHGIPFTLMSVDNPTIRAQGIAYGAKGVPFIVLLNGAPTPAFARLGTLTSPDLLAAELAKL